MRLLIAAVGKLKQGPERELFAHCLGRANATGRKIGLTPLSVIEVAEAKSATAQVRMETEGKALLAKLPSSHKLICLDRGGDQFRNELCADPGEVSGRRRPGPLTLPHGLARIVLAEQIYRTGTILMGHPYHRG